MFIERKSFEHRTKDLPVRMRLALFEEELEAFSKACVELNRAKKCWVCFKSSPKINRAPFKIDPKIRQRESFQFTESFSSFSVMQKEGIGSLMDFAKSGRKKFKLSRTWGKAMRYSKFPNAEMKIKLKVLSY